MILQVLVHQKRYEWVKRIPLEIHTNTKKEEKKWKTVRLLGARAIYSNIIDTSVQNYWKLSLWKLWIGNCGNSFEPGFLKNHLFDTGSSSPPGHLRMGKDSSIIPKNIWEKEWNIMMSQETDEEKYWKEKKLGTQQRLSPRCHPGQRQVAFIHTFSG